MQQRPHPVLLPLAGARVQDEAGGDNVVTITPAGPKGQKVPRVQDEGGGDTVVTMVASTGGNHWPVSSCEEGGVLSPLAWQGGRGAAAGRRKYFSR